MTTNEFLTDLMQRRNTAKVGYASYNYLETYGASLVEVTAFEPDPLTYRSDYYYNAKENVLYQRFISKRIHGVPVIAYWKSVST